MRESATREGPAAAAVAGDRLAEPAAEAAGRPGRLRFRVAQEPWEWEQVYALNYRTFVEEIPQHGPNPDRKLVDQLLEGSTCYIALDGRLLAGMVAISHRRPFSLDKKLPDLDRYLPPGARPCEMRLLAVPEDRRGGMIFTGLFRKLLRHSRDHGYDVAVISAAERQVPLYRHIGFEPFGPPLGTPEAPFQAMFLTWDRLCPSGFRLLSEASEEGER